MVVEAKPVTAVVSGPSPGGIALERIQPNPFRGSARIVCRLGRAGPVELDVRDIGGRRVFTLARGLVMPAGESEPVWDGRCGDGQRAPAGICRVCLDSRDGMDERRFARHE